MDAASHAAPKVFISYSWTSELHTAWVGDLGERLMNDGVDVILDQWSLEDGHDVNAFMERMVSDSSVKRVIIVSDKLYAAKADDRRGGVGTETQIISKRSTIRLIRTSSCLSFVNAMKMAMLVYLSF